MNRRAIEMERMENDILFSNLPFDIVNVLRSLYQYFDKLPFLTKDQYWRFVRYIMKWSETAERNGYPLPVDSSSSESGPSNHENNPCDSSNINIVGKLKSSAIRRIIRLLAFLIGVPFEKLPLEIATPPAQNEVENQHPQAQIVPLVQWNEKKYAITEVFGIIQTDLTELRQMFIN